MNSHPAFYEFDKPDQKAPSFAIIADDLTGANACGVQIAKEGLKASLVFESTAAAFCDVILFSTDSRAIPAKEASERVFKAAKDFNARYFAKRIDSTLRGNVGAEVSALSDALNEKYGCDSLCIICPAFPSAGRTVINGKLYVNQKLLHETEAANDPLYPIKDSDIKKIIADSCLPSRPFDLVHIDQKKIRGGALSDEFIKVYARGVRYISVDAQDDLDIEFIAKAITESGLPVTTADPGPLTGRRAGLTSENNDGHKILLSVGSVFETTAIQVEALCARTKLAHAELDVAKLVNKNSLRQNEIKRAADTLINAKERLLLLTLSSLKPENRLDFDSVCAKEGIPVGELPLMITDAIAEVTRMVTKALDIAGVLASGGDVAVAICKELNAKGIKLADEVMPLVSFGFLDGGEADGLAIATKGGFVGTKNSLIECVEYLYKITSVIDKSKKTR